MRRNAHLFRRIAGVGMLIIGIQPFLTNIISINPNVLGALTLIAAGFAILGQSGRYALGMVALACWLLISGMLIVLNSLGTGSFPFVGTILALLAIAAGILLLIDR